MNYQFSNLLGAPYRGGTLLIHQNELLTPVGNRIGQVSLTESTSRCLPFENLTQIRVLCVSPDGSLLMSVDADGRALLINRKRQALLHHFSFKGAVAAACFSPDGKFLAVAVGRLVQVWVCPSLDKQMSPMQLHRTYGQCHADVLDLAWSPDSQFVSAASKDITLRVFSLNPIQGYEPPTLAGHKDTLIGTFFTTPQALAREQALAGEAVPLMYSLSTDGALHAWSYEAGPQYDNDNSNYAAHVSKRRRTEQRQQAAAEQQQQPEAEGGEGAEGRAGAAAAGGEEGPSTSAAAGFPRLAGGKWFLSAKHYFHQRGARVSAYAWHAPSGLLAVGFTNGIFDLYQMPSFESLHTLSVSRERITSLAFNHTGDWIAVGCAQLGQLLVWEWRSETYVLKQQGHYFDIAAASFSPDGALIATGADDNKVKVFQQSTGFCFVTFPDHTAPVTAVAFLPSGHALLSASLDGTVRAFDLVRYRNFRTMTTPDPVQFGTLAVDPSGDVVVAGTVDTFQIYAWSLKTGRLLDVMAGHEGPVSGLSFSASTALLASASWDKTVRTWDLFGGSGSGTAADVLEHNHDVLALAHRPDGKQLASATLDGQIYFWDPREAVLQGTIEGRRDIKGGRMQGDRRAAGNLASGAAFTSLAYSADGALLIAGGASKYVCIYDALDRVMLRRFQLSHNRALDGVLDVLNSRNMTDAGPLQLIDEDKDEDVELLPPTIDVAAAADVPGTAKGKRPAVRCRAVTLSPAGRCWAAATTEGLMVYSLDEGLVFDPTDLTEDLTPAACQAALDGQAFVRAALIALRLGDPQLLRHCLLSTPPQQVATAAGALPPAFVPQVLTQLAEALSSSPHLEFLLTWVRAVCAAHGEALRAAASGAVARGAAAGGGAGSAVPSSAVMPALRALQKCLTRLHADLAHTCEGNAYTLDYLVAAGAAAAADGLAAGDDGGEQ